MFIETLIRRALGTRFRFEQNRRKAELGALSDTALKDLGISRSEITSCANYDAGRRRSWRPNTRS